MDRFHGRRNNRAPVTLLSRTVACQKDNRKMPPRSLRPVTPPMSAQWPFEEALGEVPPPAPAFVSAADILRAKIRACAARSFAAQHKGAVRAAVSGKDGGEESQAAMAAGRGARKLGQDGPRAHS
jgi:hypothetical protein